MNKIFSSALFVALLVVPVSAQNSGNGASSAGAGGLRGTGWSSAGVKGASSAGGSLHGNGLSSAGGSVHGTGYSSAGALSAHPSKRTTGRAKPKAKRPKSALGNINPNTTPGNQMQLGGNH